MSPVRHVPGMAPGTGDCLKCKARRNWLILCYIATVVTVVLVLVIQGRFR